MRWIKGFSLGAYEVIFDYALPFGKTNGFTVLRGDGKEIHPAAVAPAWSTAGILDLVQWAHSVLEQEK